MLQQRFEMVKSETELTKIKVHTRDISSMIYN
jgi:hypothetical protein